jgi:hypothetical protein
VEHQVVALASPGEVLARVVEDLVGAELGRLLDVPCAADSRDFRAERLRDLDRERADATGGPR